MSDDAFTNEPAPRPIGQWKQEILRVYNRVKQDVSGTGVERQRVHLDDSYVMIVALHQRVPALATIAQVDTLLGRWGDVAVIDANKLAFERALTTDLGIRPSGVYQDYDPETQTAVTVVLLTAPLPVG